MRSVYKRLPEEVRRVLRPFNLLDEVASFLPERPRRRLHAIAESGRRLQRLATTRYPVRLVSGRAPGGALPLTVLLAMDDLSARYWRDVLFAGATDERRVGDVQARAVPSTSARLSALADVALWQVPWPVRPHGCGAIVPSWVPLWLPTDRSLEEVVAGERSGRSARKNDVRRVARLGVEVRIASDRAAWDSFRERLYLPYVRRRFDDLAVPVPPPVFRHARRHGGLLLVERDGVPVSGAVLEHGRDATAVLVFGVSLDGPVPSGAAVEACYYHAIRFAVERGFRRLSLGACRPVLTDGVLRYKRKWGARIGTPVRWDAFALRYRNTAAVRAALTASPLVIDLGDGRLAALAGAAGDAGRDLGEVDHQRRRRARRAHGEIGRASCRERV